MTLIVVLVYAVTLAVVVVVVMVYAVTLAVIVVVAEACLVVVVNK